jgi:hypothetical protein
MSGFRDCDRCKNKGGPGYPCRTCGLVGTNPDDIRYAASHRTADPRAER